MIDDKTKAKIKKLAEDFLKEEKPSNDRVPVSGKVFDRDELTNLIEASLEGWWTEGPWTARFEQGLKDFLGVKYVHACNSGSSANLLAFATLCSESLGSRRIKPGDEVITLACGFPTTVNPIIQNGCLPVFIDIEASTYNVEINHLEKALSPKTKAVMMAHTLGNPFNLKAVTNFCRKHKLWLIEDNCDALGSKYEGKFTGTFGDIATLSFYPAHHITTAEGGAVITNNSELSKIAVSIRDWGRHCWCPTGKDNTCKNRFNWKLGQLPEGYDHKYIYGELGYNLKMSDLHAAIGVAQLKKLDRFIKIRKENFGLLTDRLKKFEKYLILPQATINSEPCWFGYPITLKPEVDRQAFLKYLDEKGVGTRLLFAGNLLRQPYFERFSEGKDYRVATELKNTDMVMNRTFWLGLSPLTTKEMIEKINQVFQVYFEKRRDD